MSCARTSGGSLTFLGIAMRAVIYFFVPQAVVLGETKAVGARRQVGAHSSKCPTKMP